MTFPSLAVVFDSAGTLLQTWRTAKNVRSGEIIPEVQTTLLTSASPDRVLTMLPIRPRAMMAQPPETLLSTYLLKHGCGFAVSCSSRPVSTDDVRAALYGDDRARCGDMQDCIRTVWACCRDEPVVALNAGVIVSLAIPGIEFTVTTGGVPFPGAVEAVRDLHALGVDVFIASGDRIEKLIPMARRLGVPDHRVHGTATPLGKAAIVRRLRGEYDRVLMVGDGENDVAAMREADLGVLSLQQPGERSPVLSEAAGRTITDLAEVVGITLELMGAEPYTDKR